MFKIAIDKHGKRSSFSPDTVVYWTGRVSYWTRGAVWIFTRSFRSAADCERWMRDKRDFLTTSGPDAQRAA